MEKNTFFSLQFMPLNCNLPSPPLCLSVFFCNLCAIIISIYLRLAKANISNVLIICGRHLCPWIWFSVSCFCFSFCKWFCEYPGAKSIALSRLSAYQNNVLISWRQGQYSLFLIGTLWTRFRFLWHSAVDFWNHLRSKKRN